MSDVGSPMQAIWTDSIVGSWTLHGLSSRWINRCWLVMRSIKPIYGPSRHSKALFCRIRRSDPRSAWSWP